MRETEKIAGIIFFSDQYRRFQERPSADTLPFNHQPLTFIL